MPPEAGALASAGSRLRPGVGVVSQPLTAALCCGFCSPRTEGQARGALADEMGWGVSQPRGWMRRLGENSLAQWARSSQGLDRWGRGPPLCPQTGSDSGAALGL